MAQATFKTQGLLELVKAGWSTHGREFSSLPRIFQQVSGFIAHSRPKASSTGSPVSLKTVLKEDLESETVKSSVGFRRICSSQFANTVGKLRSTITSSSTCTSQQGVRKILGTGELVRGYGCTRDHELQRLRVVLRKGQPEVRSLLKAGRGDVRGYREYHVDNRGVQHFKRRGPASWTEKFATQRSIGFLVVLAGGGIVIYLTNQQTVPYTHRRHFMLVSPRLERSIGDRSFDMIMKEYKRKVLPASHPQSLRVHEISDQIIEALMLGVRASDWGQLEQGVHDMSDTSSGWDRDPAESRSEKPLLGPHDDHAHAQDEVLDEAWVDKSRERGLQSGEEGYTKHLEGMKWKVLVVDDETVNAICIPGGKIVVFTGLLKKFRSNAEVATVIAHEVGHAVARHSAEALTHNLFIVALQLVVLSVFYVPGLVNSVSELILRLPFSRRALILRIVAKHEICTSMISLAQCKELSVIGLDAEWRWRQIILVLSLMAAAGYDPRLAPGFYERLGQLEKVPEYAQYMSTHPSGKKRGEMLRHTATMEEAMKIYQRKMAGQGCGIVPIVDPSGVQVNCSEQSSQ